MARAGAAAVWEGVVAGRGARWMRRLRDSQATRAAMEATRALAHTSAVVVRAWAAMAREEAARTVAVEAVAAVATVAVRATDMCARLKLRLSAASRDSTLRSTRLATFGPTMQGARTSDSERPPRTCTGRTKTCCRPLLPAQRKDDAAMTQRVECCHCREREACRGKHKALECDAETNALSARYGLQSCPWHTGRSMRQKFWNSTRPLASAVCRQPHTKHLSLEDRYSEQSHLDGYGGSWEAAHE